MSVTFALSDLQKGLKPAIRYWPEAQRESLESYLRSARRRRRASRAGDDGFGQPYWILLPSWLHAHYREQRVSRTGDRALLPDVLRAQYCLFLAFRIRDDLMDDVRTSRHLAGAADRLIEEAGSILSRRFGPRSSFWKTYRGSIFNTAAALKKLDRLQRSPRADLQKMLRQYSRVNSIFRIGSAAVCRHHARMTDYPLIRAFSDRFSAGCQILDDLSDITEDLGRRRWNFAVNYILRRSPSPLPGRRSGVPLVAGSLASGDAGAKLLGAAARLLDRAFAAIEPLGLPEAERCRRTYLDSLGRINREFSRARMFQTISRRPGNDRRRRSENP